MPILRGQLRRGGASIRLMILVDTGAAYSLASLSFARYLGISAETLDGAPAIELSGFGSSTLSVARRVACDLVLGKNPHGQEILLPEAAIYFTAAQIPFEVDLLLGQVDALERLSLLHRNHLPTPEFVLGLP